MSQERLSMRKISELLRLPVPGTGEMGLQFDKSSHRAQLPDLPKHSQGIFEARRDCGVEMAVACRRSRHLTGKAGRRQTVQAFVPGEGRRPTGRAGTAGLGASPPGTKEAACYSAGAVDGVPGIPSGWVRVQSVL